MAHRRAATRVYVIAHIPKDKKQQFEEITQAISDEAKKHGVGFILVDNPCDYDTWEVVREAERVEPDPIRLNEFIAQQFSEEKKQKIILWVR